jgi:hypothetical protein
VAEAEARAEAERAEERAAMVAALAAAREQTRRDLACVREYADTLRRLDRKGEAGVVERQAAQLEQAGRQEGGEAVARADAARLLESVRGRVAAVQGRPEQRQR